VVFVFVYVRQSVLFTGKVDVFPSVLQVFFCHSVPIHYPKRIPNVSSKPSLIRSSTFNLTTSLLLFSDYRLQNISGITVRQLTEHPRSSIDRYMLRTAVSCRFPKSHFATNIHLTNVSPHHPHKRTTAPDATTTTSEHLDKMATTLHTMSMCDAPMNTQQICTDAGLFKNAKRRTGLQSILNATRSAPAASLWSNKRTAPSGDTHPHKRSRISCDASELPTEEDTRQEYGSWTRPTSMDLF
jgi:hypothetical protein